MATEYRCTCRKCKTVYCFNDRDVKAYKLARGAVTASLVSGVIDAAGGNAVSSIEQMETGRAVSQAVRDLTRCPRCGSIDIAVQRNELIGY